MTPFTLHSKAIATIRYLLSTYLTRDEMKQFLLEAGASSDRILRIDASGNMRSPTYTSKSGILNTGYDTIFDDFDKAEAVGILCELARLIFSRKRVSEGDRRVLEAALSASGVNLTEIIESSAGQDVVHLAVDSLDTANLKEARDLLKKALLRMDTDPSGAITAAVSAAESVCREALTRLNIALPAKKQLPDYLAALCKQTNIEDLAALGGEDARKVFGSLRGLAQNTYQAAHQVGDRHAHGDTAASPSAVVVEMLVTSACAITVVLAGALRREELKP
jgi:hypothetical protein